MLKQIFKRLQLIPILLKLNIFCFFFFEIDIKLSPKTKHYFNFLFLPFFDQFTRYLLFKKTFRKLIKFSLTFCIQNKIKIFSEKIIVPESKFA